MTKISSRDLEQTLGIGVNLLAFAGSNPSEIYSLVSSKFVTPRADVLMKVQRPVVYLTADEKSLGMKLPSLLLQPIVENAIKFGLYDHIGDVTISVKAKPETGKLVIEVRNPFDPVTSQPRKGTGFGLTSIQRRLYLLYAQNDLLTIETENATFITVLKIPQSLWSKP